MNYQAKQQVSFVLSDSKTGLKTAKAGNRHTKHISTTNYVPVPGLSWTRIRGSIDRIRDISCSFYYTILCMRSDRIHMTNLGFMTIQEYIWDGTRDCGWRYSHLDFRRSAMFNSGFRGSGPITSSFEKFMPTRIGYIDNGRRKLESSNVDVHLYTVWSCGAIEGFRGWIYWWISKVIVCVWAFGSGWIGQSLLVQQYHIYQADGMIRVMGWLGYWNIGMCFMSIVKETS